jgi:hypothetical protein
MIDLRPLKSESPKLPESLKSVIEMQKGSMQDQDFVDFFIGLRRKAREIDSQNREVVQK